MIASTFALLDVAVFETNFENLILSPGDAIAWSLTCLQLFKSEGLNLSEWSGSV